MVDQDRRRVPAVGRGADQVAVEPAAMTGDRHPLERHAEAGWGLRAIGTGAERLLADHIGDRGAADQHQGCAGERDPQGGRALHRPRPPTPRTQSSGRCIGSPPRKWGSSLARYVRTSGQARAIWTRAQIRPAKSWRIPTGDRCRGHRRHEASPCSAAEGRRFRPGRPVPS